jgi:hypothetical protein
VTDGQLALGIHEGELGEIVEHADLNLERADAAEARLLAAIAALGHARPCHCERGPLVDSRDGGERCIRCGREVAG